MQLLKNSYSARLSQVASIVELIAPRDVNYLFYRQIPKFLISSSKIT